MKKVFTLLIALLLAITGSWAQTSNYFNGFETTVGTGDWATTTIRASGHNGIPASTGSFYGGTGTDHTRFGGYNLVFPALGYKTSLDIYLNVAGGYANNSRFDYTSAINNTGGAHRRDFIFNGGFYNDATPVGTSNTNRFIFSASNNSGTSAWPANPARNPIAISESGWYTFEHHFYNNGSGVLAVDLKIYNSADVLMGSWTLSDATDIIGSTVGGNRYGWIATNQLGTLAIDNSSLTVILPKPITSIGSPIPSPCGTLDVPVTVKDFKNIGAISLVLNFDPTKLQLLPIELPTFQGVTLNPALAVSGAPSANNTIGQFRFADFPVPAITLADDAVLFTLHFNVLPAAVGGTTTPLTWSTVSQECEYAGPGGSPTYASTFTNGSATIPARPVRNTTTLREYCTIQAAINDAATVATHTLEVHAALYNVSEQVLVNKEVTIKGINGKPTVNFLGTVTGKPTLFDISANNVTIDNIRFNVDLAKLKSAIIASAAGIDNITIKNNLIDCYGTPSSGTYGDRNAVSINYNGNTNYRVASGGVDNVIFTGNTVNFGTQGGFRSGISADEVGGTFSENTLQSINHEILVRFAGNGDVTVTGNFLNGGGMEFTDFNAGAGTLTINGNQFNGAVANAYSNALRLKNNYTARPTVVSGNTFTGFEGNVAGYGGTLSLENYQAVTINNNTFTPLANSTVYRHITLNTKDLSSSSGFYAPVVGATFTNNTFNGSGTPGGTALAFYNWDNDAPVFNAITIGTAGNENTFNDGIAKFIVLDGSTGTVAPNATAMVPWAVNLDAQNNKFALPTPTLPSAMTLAQLFALEDKIDHKIDNQSLGFVTVKANNNYVTINSFVAPNTTPLIQRGVNAASSLWTVNVADGTYIEDVVINKQNLTILGQSRTGTILKGLYLAGATNATISFPNTNADGAIVKNMTISRDYQDWYKSTKNYGVLLSGGVNNVTLENLLVKDNRNAVYVENNGQLFMSNSTIEMNRTGLHISNTVRGNVRNNIIRNNQTHGVFYNLHDGTSDLSGFLFNDNSLSGNWYSQVTFRGVNTLAAQANFECNWYGTNAPTSNPTDPSEAGYTQLIPQQFDGTSAQATYAGEMRGNGASFIDYVSWRTGEASNVSDPFVPGNTCNGTPVVVTFVSKTDETCLGKADGTIKTTISGGTIPYVIVWTPGGANTAEIASLPTGTYNVLVTDANGSTATLAAGVVIGTVPDVTPPSVTPPVDVTVTQQDAKDPYATGYATGTDNCTAIVTITYNDDRSKLNLCNATGYITRTWTAKDAAGNTATAKQTITVNDVTNPVVNVPANILANTDTGVCTAVVTYTTPTATDFGHFQGFENAAWVAAPAATLPSTDWNEYNSPIVRVATGTNGINSKTGAAHAEITPGTGQTGVFSRLGGFTGTFGAGFTTSVDVYFNLSDAAVTANTYGWDVSSAVSNQSSAHLRDYIFHTASDGEGKILVAGSNNSNFARRNDLATLNHYTVNSSGWYTLEWNFRDNGLGSLAVDLNLRDASGGLLWTETRTTTDNISTAVGGNRYMWFTFVAADKLAIDNTTLTRKLAVTSTPASGSVFAKGVTTVNVSATDACHKTTTNSFTVTVVDNQAPVITKCAPAQSAVVTTGCTVAMPDFTSSVVATDNCAVTSVTQVPAIGTIMPYQATPYDVTITVMDAAGLTATCKTSFTVQKATLSGKLVYNNTATTPMNKVKLILKDSGGNQVGSEVTTAESTGAFTFPNLCAGTYTIHITDNQKDAGGINATDAAQVNAWSVTSGSAPIEHVKFLAGDVTFNKFISSADALKIQRYFVFGDVFEAPKWSYWKKGEIINSNLVPYNGISAWPTNITVTVAGNVPNLELYGMLTGDYDGSLIPTILKSTRPSLTLAENSNLQIGANQAFELPLRAASAMQVGAVSMILDIPSELVKVQNVKIKGSNDPVMWSINGNELRIGWHSLNPVNVAENGTLLTLELMTTNAFTQGRTLDIVLPFDPINELANGRFEAMDNAELKVAKVGNGTLGNLDIDKNGGLLFSNYPNPFSRATTIEYSLPVDGKVTINLYNNLGQLMSVLVSADQKAGQHTFRYESNTLQPGIYVAKLQLVNSETNLVGTIKLNLHK